MLLVNELRAQYPYFALTAVVSITILLLTFLCMRINFNEKYLEDLKITQKKLNFVKPAANWNYNNTWRSIGNASTKNKIYSAYFDTRLDVIENISEDETQIPVGSIRVFAILPTHFKDTIICTVRYEDFISKEIKIGNVKALHDDHAYFYSAYSIMCPLHINRKDISQNVRLPQAVAISYSSDRMSHFNPTFIPISYPRNMKNIFAQSYPVLSVCVGPLQLHYANVLRIVEFVEMYRILGVTHFYFYNLNASDDVRRLIEYYRSKGLADLLDWNLRDHTDDIHYGGIVAQYNECIYRAMIVDNYRYAAVIDLDELLVPLKHNSLMNYLRQCDEGRTSAYIFRNVFFHKKDSNDTASVPPHTRNRMLYSQLKIRRTVEIMPPYKRSKYIANVRSIIETGNHQTYQTMPGYSESIVHQSVGLLFHYRDKCINCKEVLMIDFTARRFGSLLWDNVDDTCLQVFTEQQGYCPLS